MVQATPELELLRELLETDPAHGSFLQVGRVLFERGSLVEAETVLKAGLMHRPEKEGWGLLAEVLVARKAPRSALEALSKAGIDRGPVLAEALHLTGRNTEAHSVAKDALEADPGNERMQTLTALLEADSPPPSLSADDPFLTVGRARRYREAGHPDRAIRVLRRVLHAHPDARGVQSLLAVAEAQASPDDPSTLDLPTIEAPAAEGTGSPPPGLVMPESTLKAPDPSMLAASLDHESTVLMTAAHIMNLLSKRGMENVAPQASRVDLAALRADDDDLVDEPTKVIPPHPNVARGRPAHDEKPADVLGDTDPDAITADDSVGDSLMPVPPPEKKPPEEKPRWPGFDPTGDSLDEATDATVLYSPDEVAKHLKKDDP